MKKLEEMIGMAPGSLKATLFDIGINLAITIAILIIGFWLAKFLGKSIEKLMKKHGTDESLIGFLKSLVTVTIKLLVVVTAISQLGIEMTSFIAILGAAGLAIGMAFSGTLSNFAGGVMILVFKPYKVGEFVEIDGHKGTVKEIQIFNTILTALDNRIIILPNGPTASGIIVNYTREDIRRVDWSFGIAYGDDLQKAKDLLEKFFQEDKRIFDDPGHFLKLGELADSSVNITARAWCKTEDYWDVHFDMNERVYNEFDKAGLSIPFPQMDVHIEK